MSRSGRTKRTRPPASRRRRIVVRSLLAVLALAIILPIAALVWLWPRCSGEDCPSVEALREYEPPQASRVLDRSGELIAHLAPERRIIVPLERIPSRVSGAFLAVEDKRFFQHDGIDYRRALGALLRDIQTLSFEEGFSTITMQLARNVFPGHLTREKTLRRKLWEIVLAREIEQAFSKDEILEMYLNQIYLGNGLYGVEAAAQGYFGKPAVELGTAEAAMLAALPKAPNTYDPRRNPELALQRRNLVLSLMARAGVITAAEAADARAEPIDLVPPIEASGDAPYLVAAIRKELRELFGAEAENAGLRVYTGLDRRLQTAAVEELRSQLAAIEDDEYGEFRGPSCSEGEVEEPGACLQGLFVAVDVQSGDVLALVGGRDFALSQFDRATQARRQAGSAFKPFVYATALAQGIPISTQLTSVEEDDLEGGYRPADHVADSASLDLREGLRLSSNRAAVELGERVGVSEVVRTARNMGISTPIQEFPSTFLGAADVIPLELVAAYTAFANNGIVVEPRLIRKVENSSGRVLWQSQVQQHRALPAAVAFLTTDLMRDVVDRGTGYRVREAGLPYAVPAAGKTGTTNESADAWFVGITPDVSAGVWIGFDQPRRIMYGAGGGRIAAPVWGRVMARYYQNRPAPAPWIAPIDLLSVTIDRATGQRATEACPSGNVTTEWFIPGTEPTEYCELHPEPGVGGWFRRRVRDLNDWFGGTRVEEPAPTVPPRTDSVRRPVPAQGDTIL
jgi:penicillin-binding protein 1A